MFKVKFLKKFLCFFFLSRKHTASLSKLHWITWGPACCILICRWYAHQITVECSVELVVLLQYQQRHYSECSDSCLEEEAGFSCNWVNISHRFTISVWQINVFVFFRILHLCGATTLLVFKMSIKSSFLPSSRLKYCNHQISSYFLNL